MPVPGRQPARARLGVRFAGIAAGNFLITVDATILNVAVPDMRRDLHAPAAAVPWTVDAYTVVLAGLLLASGSAADRWGPLRVYRAALAGFAVVSALCATAPDTGVLIACRALLGVPAAGLVPASLALLSALCPEPDRRSRAIGALIAISGTGIAGGPVIGGALVAAGGWRLVFLVNPPIALLALFASRGIGDHRSGTAAPADRAGLLLSVTGLTALAFGLVDAGTSGWLRTRPLLALLTAAAAFAALPAQQRRAAAPVLPPALTGLTRVRVDLLVAITSQLVYYGLLFTLSQWMISTRGMPPFQAGLAFLPMTAPIALVPLLTGRLVARHGPSPMMLAGMTLNLLGGLLLAFGGTSSWVIFGVEALIGTGGPLATPAYIADLSHAVPLALAGTSQGALNASRQAGTALGVAIFGPLASLDTAGTIMTVAAGLTLAVIVRNRGKNDTPA